MCKGARVYAKNYAAARKDLVALAKLQPWEAKGLPSWQEYARDLFGASERQLYREFAAAKVAAMIEEKSDQTCQGMTGGQFSTLGEWLIRPLTANDFTDEERLEIWGKATATAQARVATSVPSAAEVEMAANEYRRQRAFNLLSVQEQRRVLAQEEEQRQAELKRAKAAHEAELVETARDYLSEAATAYERGVGLVRRAGRKLLLVEACTRRIMDHVQAAVEGTEQVLQALREGERQGAG